MSQDMSLIEERLEVATRSVATARVRISKRVSEHIHEAEVNLTHQHVVVERVEVNRLVDERAAARQEGDVLVVPIYEEVLVKRWLLKEELRVTRRSTVEQRHIGPERLRREEIAITRTPIAPLK
jgi:uncharacterized protein (TIGR02271 family)